VEEVDPECAIFDLVQDSGFVAKEKCGTDWGTQERIRTSRKKTLEALSEAGILKPEFVERVLYCTNFYAQHSGRRGAELRDRPMEKVFLLF
jgi:hypothetical protein